MIGMSDIYSDLVDSFLLFFESCFRAVKVLLLLREFTMPDFSSTMAYFATPNRINLAHLIESVFLMNLFLIR